EMQDAAHRGGPRWAAEFAIVRSTALRSVLARHLRLDPRAEQLHGRGQRAAEVLGVATDPDLQDVVAGEQLGDGLAARLPPDDEPAGLRHLLDLQRARQHRLHAAVAAAREL